MGNRISSMFPKKSSVNSKLLMADGAPLKIYLDGFDIPDFLKISRLIRLYGGKLTNPDHTTVILSTGTSFPGTMFVRFHVNWLYDSIESDKLQDIGKYLIPAAVALEDSSQLNIHNGASKMVNGDRWSSEEKENSVNKSTHSPKNQDDKGLKIFNGDTTPSEKKSNKKRKFDETLDNPSDAAGSPVDALPPKSTLAKNPAVITTPEAVEMKIKQENKRKCSEIREDFGETSPGAPKLTTELKTDEIQFTEIDEASPQLEKMIAADNGDAKDDVTDLGSQIGSLFEDDDGDGDFLSIRNSQMATSDPLDGLWRMPNANSDEYFAVNLDEPVVCGEKPDPESAGESTQEAASEASRPVRSKASKFTAKRRGRKSKADAKPKIRYTKEEDERIIRYLVENSAVSRIRGVKVWQEMCAKGLFPNRSWAALKLHFINYVRRDVSKYIDDPMYLQQFEALSSSQVH